jgi:hypothetical protein
VYFVDHGWVIFEPTVSQPALILPTGLGGRDEQDESQSGNLPGMDDLLPTPESSEDETSPAGEEGQPIFQLRGSRIIWGIFILFLILLSLTALILIRPNIFRINIDPLPVLLERRLRKRGEPVPSWILRWSRIAQMSAAEKAYRQLSLAIQMLGQPLNQAQTPAERAQSLLALLPDAAEPVQDVVNEYTLDQFSNHIINEERAKTAARQIRKMTLRAWFQKLNPFKVPDKA